jgi:predicted TIM-barrel fold metal-dependent hydrolase
LIRVNGQEIFVIDDHVHLWDGRKENWLQPKYAEGWLMCFYDYHKSLSPPEYIWPLEKYAYYGPDTFVEDVFVKGYVDMGIFQPTYLTDFFKNGWNTTEQNGVLKARYPDRFILNTSFDPRDGEAGLEIFEQKVKKWGCKGLKLYTAEWRGNSKGWGLKDPWAYKYLEKCVELGVKNIFPHKGPTIWPYNKDAFDVHDVDEVATSFPELNFIVAHAGVPRIDDFCWIAKQDKNVYADLAVVLAFIWSRPRYTAEMLAEMLYWLGPDRILFGSDYALWHPKWIIEEFLRFELPKDIESEYKVDLSLETKKKILGLNAARLYDIDIEAQKKKLARDEIATKYNLKPAEFTIPPHLT